MFKQDCKPGYVPRRASVIYLGPPSPTASSDLPPDIGRAVLHASVYLVLQPVVRHALHIAAQAVGSYPAVSPLPEGGLFSVACARPHGRLPVRKHGALRCPDFPPAPKGRRRTVLLSGRKDNKNRLKSVQIKINRRQPTTFSKKIITFAPYFTEIAP